MLLLFFIEYPKVLAKFYLFYVLIPNLLSGKMTHVKKTDDVCRKSVCLFCFKKRKGLQEINENREIIDPNLASGEGLLSKKVAAS